MQVCRSLAIGILIFAVTLCSASPPRPLHLIIGTWRLYVPEANCIETWEFRADGTSHNYSGSEESISQYTVSDEPTAAGYYILLDTITETNGQPDCLGNTVPVGDRATGYLVPAPGDQLRLCSDTALTECFTMVRVARPNSGAKVVESTLPDPDAVLTDTVPCRVGSNHRRQDDRLHTRIICAELTCSGRKI